MSLFKRFTFLGSILLMAALVFTFSPKAPSAHAAPAIPAFTCPSRTICFFQSDGYTGADISCPTDVCTGNAWYSTFVGGVNAGSVNDNSQSVFKLKDAQNGNVICLPPGRHVLDHIYGFYDVLYGVPNCPS